VFVHKTKYYAAHFDSVNINTVNIDTVNIDTIDVDYSLYRIYSIL